MVYIMVYSATESYYSQILSFASLRKCMVDFWFILLLNGTIPEFPKHYLSPRESVRSIQVYMYSVFYIICVKSGIKLSVLKKNSWYILCVIEFRRRLVGNIFNVDDLIAYHRPAVGNILSGNHAKQCLSPSALCL